MTRWPLLAPYLAMVLADVGEAMLSGEYYAEAKPWEGGEYQDPPAPRHDFGSGE